LPPRAGQMALGSGPDYAHQRIIDAKRTGVRNRSADNRGLCVVDQQLCGRRQPVGDDHPDPPARSYRCAGQGGMVSIINLAAP
jgi:hypothetical protein